MNIKQSLAQKKVQDTNKERVEDFMRSGGSGSLRSSLFNRTDEVITNEMVETFTEQFKEGMEMDVKGGESEDYKGKQVMMFYVEIPDSVPVGKVEALLAKVDYDKEKHIFKALYRPKNGKWGQAQATGEKIKFK